MSVRTAALALEVTSDARAAAAEVDDLADSYRDLDRAADKAAQVSAKVADQHAAVADATDNLASKSGQATGALGALSSGFELVGAEKYAGALQGAALATDFMSGVGDSLNLIMELQAVKNIRATATMVAHRVATTASAAATKAAAAAQWAMNAAMTANPIGLVVAAVVALVALFVVLYKRSETVRTIINAVGSSGRVAIGWVVDRVADLVGWVRDKAPAAFAALRSAAVTAFRIVTTPTRLWLNVIRTVAEWVGTRIVAGFNTLRATGSAVLSTIRGAFDRVKTAVSTARDWVADKLTAAFTTAKTKVEAVRDALVAPFNAVRDAVQGIIDKIANISFPKPPGWLTSGLGAIGIGDGRLMLATPRLADPAAPSVSITVNGALDPNAVSRQLVELLRRHGVIQPGMRIA